MGLSASRIVTSFLIISFTHVSGQAFAVEPPNCKVEISNLCKQHRQAKDPQKILNCIKENRSKLSTSCQKNIDQMLGSKNTEKELQVLSCGQEFLSFCKAAQKKGPSELLSCLNKNSSKMTLNCQTLFSKMKETLKNQAK